MLHESVEHPGEPCMGAAAAKVSKCLCNEKWDMRAAEEMCSKLHMLYAAYMCSAQSAAAVQPSLHATSAPIRQLEQRFEQSEQPRHGCKSEFPLMLALVHSSSIISYAHARGPMST